ncbi:MAG: EAL domain-containing protein [Actinomycetales bacterium]|nr:EAL domain-containing protein [Actinomycetales bacterium]
MASTRMNRATVSVVLDHLMLGLGLVIAVPALVRWLLDGPAAGIAGAVSVVLVVVMSRYRLALAHRAGDILLGFETCVLVFLTLNSPPLEAFCLWAIGTTVANATLQKAWRLRAFNIGLTITGGAIFVLVVNALDAGTDPDLDKLGAIMIGCAIYFAYDLVVTAASLAVEDGCSIGSGVAWSSIPMGLASFVSVDTLGFLAWVLRDKESWTLLLLAVPVGTILVAVRSVSENRIARQRLTGLLEAATHAPDWADEPHIERSLLVQAERTLRQTTASFRDDPPAPPGIGAPIEVDGRPTRHLVVTPQVSGRRFDEDDRAALEALTAVGVSAFNRRRLADEMTYLARHDALTGLANRGVFTARLAQALEQRAPHRQVAVLFIDLDGFKEVNDLLGHEAGDTLLVRVAERINLCLRLGDTAARLGGDEFGILLDDLTDEEQADLVAQRLLEALSTTFELAHRHVLVQASIGIALSGTEPSDAEKLINSADTAMYAAKGRGKGRVERFRPEMREAELTRLEIESALRLGVQEDQIHVYFQPVVDLLTGSIDGFEALARWNHPTLGSVRPDVFVPAAERLGIIQTLGLQLLERAHDGGRRLTRAAGRPLSIGVNLSAMQITDPALVERVGELVELDASVRLVLELTEGILLGDDPATIAALHRLRGVGARLAVDDFGVGYSSVGYLHRLPVDILKIDKVFISALHDTRSRALVEGVVAMARALDLTVVSEGVEDWESAVVLRDLRCELAQGHVFGRAVDLPAALRLAAGGPLDLSAMGAVGVTAITHG